MELDRESEDKTLHPVLYHKLKALVRENPDDVEIVWRFARVCYHCSVETSDPERKKEFILEGNLPKFSFKPVNMLVINKFIFFIFVNLFHSIARLEFVSQCIMVKLFFRMQRVRKSSTRTSRESVQVVRHTRWPEE